METKKASKLRNTVFVTLFATVTFAVLIAAPVKKVLEDKGLIDKSNVGNEVRVEKVYPTDMPFAAWFGISEPDDEPVGDVDSHIKDNTLSVNPFVDGLSSALNSIEEFKRLTNDTYINYIPFYLRITNSATDLQSKLNKPLNKWYQQTSNKIFLENKNKQK